jgi:hypothetical protein
MPITDDEIYKINYDPKNAILLYLLRSQTGCKIKTRALYMRTWPSLIIAQYGIEMNSFYMTTNTDMGIR